MVQVYPHGVTETEPAVPFPRLAVEQKLRLSREARFHAWSGTADRLFRLQDEMERILETVYRERTTRSDPAEDRASVAQAATEALRLRVSVLANGGRIRRIGSLRAVLAEMEPGEIKSVLLTNTPPEGQDYPLVRITMRSDGVLGKGITPPVALTVAGSDRQWVGGVFDTLSGELSRAEPRWGIMRSFSVHFALGAVIALGVAGLIAALNSPIDAPFFGWAVITFMAGFFGGGMLGGVVLNPMMLRAFPAFEVLEAGRSSKAARTVTAAVTVLSVACAIAGIALGVLAL